MSDDAGAHISTAVEWNPVLLTNEWAYIDGNIETLYDDDWFQIYLEEGHVYRWTLAPRGTGLEPEDLNVELLDSSGGWPGNIVSVMEGEYKNLGWEATDTGFYYLDVDADFSNHTGGYTLGLKKVSSQPIPPDDYSEDQNTSGYLEVGQSLRGNIERAFDKDFIRVNLIASGDSKIDSETYTIRLVGETLEEQKIRLMLGKWTSTAYQAESHPQIEEDFIEFEYSPWYGTRSNIYYIEVTGLTNHIGSYILLLEDSTTKARISFDKDITYSLNKIKDFDGISHGVETPNEDVKSNYKYQGLIDINGDGYKEDIFTNTKSGRWASCSIDINTGIANYADHGEGGTTRIVGIYEDPLIAEGASNGGFLSDGITPAPANFGVSDEERYVEVNGETIDRLALNSQVRFQNDLKIDNLSIKTAGDYDSDGFQEVYWKTNDDTAYLRALMHPDGNIQYANYQSEAQMSDYLTAQGHESIIIEIT